MLNYPLQYNSVSMNGPTLFYIDEEGSPVQLELNREQVVGIVNDWNAEPDTGLEKDEAPHVLKLPKRAQ